MGKGRKKKSKQRSAQARGRKRHKRSVKLRGRRASGRGAGGNPGTTEHQEHVQCILDMLDEAGGDIEVLARRLGRHPYCVQRQVAAHTEEHEPHEGTAAACAVRMESLSEDEIMRRIQRLGVAINRDAFAEEAKTFDSAWEMARERWLARAEPGLDAAGRTLLCLAACELWKRWLPERSSLEMLHDAMHAGYEAERNDDVELATRHWLDLWDHLRPHLAETARSTAPLSARVACITDLSDWCCDFAETASHAALHDLALAPRSLRAIEAIDAQFTAEDPETFKVPVRIYLAELLFVLGRFADGEKLLTGVIAADPRDPRPYSALSDLLSDPQFELDRGAERAVELLERALALPVDDADFWEIPERILQLRGGLRVRS